MIDENLSNDPESAALTLLLSSMRTLHAQHFPLQQPESAPLVSPSTDVCPRLFKGQVDSSEACRQRGCVFSELKRQEEMKGEEKLSADASLAAEPSIPEESSVEPAANTKDDGKSNFVVRIGRALGALFGWLKESSPVKMSKRCYAFLERELGRWQVMVWVIASCIAMIISIVFWFSLAVQTPTLTVNASPEMVPYSELVGHLHSKTVTTLLFEEGTMNLFFNLQPNEEINPHGVEMNRVEDTADEVPATKDDKELTNESTGESNGERSESPTPSEILAPKLEGTAQTKNEIANWAYMTQRVSYNDVPFLLLLMRDAGVLTYSTGRRSVPPQPKSKIAAVRDVLNSSIDIPILLLRISMPLFPLIFLILQRDMIKDMFGNGVIGKSKRNAKRKVKFEDVAGVDIAKAELKEIVDCMKDSAKFASLGATLPKGVLLVGPPGTGKTLLARAVADEAGVPFYAASASEFVEMFVGRGAARVRQLFKMARKDTPCIVFIDELDAVGGRRGSSQNDERDQTLNQLLTEMDGFESESGVLVLAATNRVDSLDPALCRPGRLSRKVHVTAPDRKGREQVLAVHMRGVPVEEDPVLIQQRLASLTGGFVGADLANLVNEAAILAAREGRSAVKFEDFKAAVDRVKYGIGDQSREVFNGMYL